MATPDDLVDEGRGHNARAPREEPFWPAPQGEIAGSDTFINRDGPDLTQRCGGGLGLTLRSCADGPSAFSLVGPTGGVDSTFVKRLSWGWYPAVSLAELIKSAPAPPRAGDGAGHRPTVGQLMA